MTTATEAKLPSLKGPLEDRVALVTGDARHRGRHQPSPGPGRCTRRRRVLAAARGGREVHRRHERAYRGRAADNRHGPGARDPQGTGPHRH
jgi:hypothetical protein